jgi:hypothetical protein
MCSYVGENKETTLLKVPAARILSGDVDNADTIPFVGEKRFLVGIEVCGGPGFEIENIEMRESVPQIKLLSEHLIVLICTLRYHGRMPCKMVKDNARDDRSVGMMHVTKISDRFEGMVP